MASVPELVVYSLTYCAPCKDAAAFLRDAGYQFTYVEVDELPPSPRFDVKRKITPPNVKTMTYPVLCINDQEYIYGFNADVWRDRLSAAAVRQDAD